MSEDSAKNLDELLNNFERHNPSLAYLSDAVANDLIDELIKKIQWNETFCANIFDHIRFGFIDNFEFEEEFEVEKYITDPVDVIDLDHIDLDGEAYDDKLDRALILSYVPRVQYVLINLLKNNYLKFLRRETVEGKVKLTSKSRIGFAEIWVDNREYNVRDSSGLFYGGVRMMLTTENIMSNKNFNPPILEHNAFLGWVMFGGQPVPHNPLRNRRLFVNFLPKS